MKTSFKIPLFVFSLIASLLSTGIILFLEPAAEARYSVLDTSDIVTNYKLGFETQILTVNNTGIQFLGHLDVPYDQDTQFRFDVGGGQHGLEFATFFKWSPYPDKEGQPGISLAAGVDYIFKDNRSSLAFIAKPLVSMSFDTHAGYWTPYFSVPFGVALSESKTEYPAWFAPGTRWSHSNIQDWQLYAEFGINLNSAPTYFSVGASYQFD
jgi:hypothetical protein